MTDRPCKEKDMQVNFSRIMSLMAMCYGDADAIVNVESNRRYDYKKFHLLTNRVANMMMQKLQLDCG